jgi:hypothetical protein
VWAWIAHIHQPRYGEDCEARQVLEDAWDRIRELLGALLMAAH